jgi:type I restriction enzyme S subunit
MKPGYRQTEVGVIPEEWEVKPLGQVATIATGNTPPTSDLSNYGDEFLFVGPVDMGDTKFVSRTQKMLSKKGFAISRRFPKGSILFVCIGSTIGKCGIALVELSSNQQINAIIPSTSFSVDFLYYSVSAAAPRIRGQAGEQAVPIVNKSQFAGTLVALPPLPEQHAIAEALSDVDSLLGALDRLIAKKRNLKQAAIQQLLTGQVRLPGFNGKREVRRLGEVATIKDGTHQTPKYVDSGIPFYSVEHVTSGDFQNTKYISLGEHRLLTRTFKIEKGDILMTRIGSIGDCKFIDWDVEASFYVSLALLKINPGFSAAYIAHYSKLTDFQKEVALHSLQSAIPKKINLGPISEVKIEFPPLAEQTAIAEVLSEMATELASLEQQRKKTHAIKQGMMQELLTGRTRLVSPIESHA